MIYEANVKIMGKEYNSTGESVVECLDNLKPGFCRAKSVLTITKGDSKKERIIGSITTSRLFNTSPAIREAQTKQIVLLFDL